MDGEELVVIERFLHVEFAQGAVEAAHVTRVVHQLAVHHAGHLVNAVGEEQAAVENRDLGVVFRTVPPVEVDRACHVISVVFLSVVFFARLSFSRGARRRNPATLPLRSGARKTGIW